MTKGKQFITTPPLKNQKVCLPVLESEHSLPLVLFIGEITYTLYDYKARFIRSFTTNHLRYTKVDSKLDFICKTEYTKTKHKYNASSTELVVTENFVYSAQD